MTRSPVIDSSRIASRIHDILAVPDDVTWFVAFSGGLDSTVLLHVLAELAGGTDTELVALHADHGLSRHARCWRTHCERVCRVLGVEIRSTTLALGPGGGPGPEGRAREARYRWFRDMVAEGGWLFTAHHRGDQAETVVERLTRGAGPRGLRGMQAVSRMHGMNVVRPLLDMPRSAILAYARRRDLDWVTDESNEDDRFSRNFIRHRVLPLLAERWPAIESSLGRTAGVMADAQALLDDVAIQDLAGLEERIELDGPSLSLVGLRDLTTPRLRNVLRYWVHRETGVLLGGARLERVQRVLRAQSGGGMQWPPIDLRIHRARLYLVRAGQPLSASREWNPVSDLPIEPGLLLRAFRTRGAGLRPSALAAGVTVKYRRGGETCRPAGRGHRHTLKNLLQEAGVPPWRRGRIPLVVIEGEIAAVAGIAYCDPWAAGPDEEGVGIALVIQPPEQSP